MARGINKAIIVGNLGSDPETKGPACKFSVATSEAWQDKSGEKQERTEWHRVTAFGKLGEICQQYLRKGRQVYIEGSLQTREWTDKENKKNYTTETVANTVQFLGGAGGSRGEGYSGGGAGADSGRGAARHDFGGAPPDDMGPPPSDDIPF